MQFSRYRTQLNNAQERLKESDFPTAIKLYKKILELHFEDQKQDFLNKKSTEKLVHQHSLLIDKILTNIWSTIFPSNTQEIALVAVGGYGRQELHPKSDIDLLLITEKMQYYQHLIHQFLALLWDLKLEIGHSVRTVNECAEEAAKDVTVLTSLLESRLLTGSKSLYHALQQVTAETQIWSKDDFFRAKLSEQKHRHEKFYETARRLEPNIKEGPGGLRDIQTISWVARRYFDTNTISDLHNQGFLTEVELNSLLTCRELLWQIRFALHITTKRREDRLLFEYQHELAKLFGYSDDQNILAIEKFMQDYYRAVTELQGLIEMLLQLLQEAIENPGDDESKSILNDRFQITHGYLEVRNATVFKDHPTALLEVFLLTMRHPELNGIRASTIRLIRQYRSLIDAEFRKQQVNRDLFLTMLKEPTGISHAFRRMNRYGILAAYMPEFENIVGRMQYDLFHIFTVDSHTLFVIRNIRRFSVEKHQEWQPLCSKIFPTMSHPENLYIAGLFHDIAKGRGGDHSELGAEDVERFCVNHGMNKGNTKIVKWLVLNHLLMSITAQRKDINDPIIIHEFATKVGDEEILNYLYLLTIADISATNPELLTSWKEQLLLDLYNRTKQILRQGLAKPADIKTRVKERQDNAAAVLSKKDFDLNDITAIWENLEDDYFTQHSADEIAWHTQAILSTSKEELPLILINKETKRGSSAIFIYAAENDGFFAITVNTLSKLGLNVLDARIITSKTGFTLDTYMVYDIGNNPIADNFRVEEIKCRIRNVLSNPNAVSEIKRRALPRQLKFFKAGTHISFHEDNDNKYTLITIQTLDRPGLLAHIGQAFFECKTRIHNAKISTIGELADNIFTITDNENKPISDSLFLKRIEEKLYFHIDGKSKT